MVVAPCSVNSLSAIAHGTTDGLLTRAADACLKERRRLVLLFREAPLHAGHIRSMAAATENGAIVFPPVPAFYGLKSLKQRPHCLAVISWATIAFSKRSLRSRRSTFLHAVHLAPCHQGLVGKAETTAQQRCVSSTGGDGSAPQFERSPLARLPRH